MIRKIKRLPAWAWRKFTGYWKASWWHKLVVIFWLVLLVIFGTMYGIAQWYIHSESGKQVLGVSFIPDYAEELGVNPRATLEALENIGVKRFRFVSYWDNVEPKKGQYDFKTMDWEFASAEKHNAKVTLAIGLRQPRWPECHAPDWIDTSQPTDKWQPALEQYMTKVIKRYKDSPALESYQLENEYFNSFGKCHNHDRQRLIDEYNLVKKLDPNHPVIISRSNNYPNMPTGQPRPDEFGISIYRRVWSAPTGRYFEYPEPSWYYAFEAGAAKILTGRDSIIHELQAEPWPPDDKTIPETSLKEQNDSFNAGMFKERVDFAKKTGMSAAYLWGGEYWYYRWKVLGDKSVWNAAVQEFSQSNN